MKKILLISLPFLSFQAKAQNIFPVKLDNCKVESFCLDCGEQKAGMAAEDLKKLLDQLQDELNLSGIRGSVMFQVLVDNKGNGCVLSHTDQSKSAIALKIIETLNQFKRWTPAVTAGKVEEKSSINMVFTINDNKITGKVERVDMDNFKKSFDRPVKPEIFNKSYDYKNEHLQQYKISTWNSTNSGLPNNMNDNVTIDKSGLVWLTVEDGLVSFDGKKFNNEAENIPGKKDNFHCDAIATDNNNTKWIVSDNKIYSYDNKKWQQYDSAETGVGDAYDIVNNPGTGEIFFCSDQGLTIYKAGKWSNINKARFKDLPSDRVYFAKRDSRNRIWIGTFSGTAMIDENNKLTNFEKTTTIMKGKCITSMDEDENGNLYFSLYEFKPKKKGKINGDEGIGVRAADGTFRQYTTENSGMPFNHSNCVLYDKKEKVLWISTDRAGLVRFDLKEGWENYHNENSDIPTAYISTMAFDSKGNLYLATRQGLVKIEKK